MSGLKRASRRLPSGEKVLEAVGAVVVANLDGEITWASPSTGETLGLAAEFLIGKRLSALGGAFGEPPLWDPVADLPCVPAGGRWDGAAVTLHRGEANPLTLAVRLIRGDDGEIEALAVLAEETVKRDRGTAQALERIQRLALVGRMTGALVHDFNNLLVGLMGSASLLRGVVPKTGEAHEFIDLMEDAARRARSLTRRLQTFHLAAQSRRDFVDVGDLARGALRLLRPLISGRAELRAEPAEDLNPVFGDAAGLQQVILNLLFNALEGMPERGVLHVRAEAAPPSALAPEVAAIMGRVQAVCLRVGDTDAGLSADGREDEFELSDSSCGEGSGLRLAVSRAIARDHGGELTARSAAEGGKEFTLWLPAAETRAEESHDAETSSQVGQGRCVLLVDDEEIVRRITGRMLETLGFQVLSAERGKDAVQIFEEHHGEIAAVILDLVMPGMNGLEVQRRLREIDPGVSTLVSTGHAEISGETSLESEGVAGVLWKPYHLQTLAGALQEVLNR